VTGERDVLEAAAHFRLGAEPRRATPLGTGHIHETWILRTEAGTRFIVQRLNAVVFADLDAVTANLALVTVALDLPNRPVLTSEGELRWGPWRLFPYLENTRTVGPAPTLTEVEEIGRAFGEFHRSAEAIDVGRLAVTLPGFHDPSARLVALDAVAAADPCGRASVAGPELAEVDANRDLAAAGASIDPPRVPRRVAHFDAKADNVLLDQATGRTLAIIDLDTVMAGSVLWDVGDLARSLTTTVPEDDPEPERVSFSDERFAALLLGYRREADAFLTEHEIAGLPVAPVVVTFEQAVRFLSDYLAGDSYYRVTRPEQNLQRSRTQLALLRSMLRAGLGPGQ
jgi:Ser/Thr protein kinase RdoA (MazF antagonist)